MEGLNLQKFQGAKKHSKFAEKKHRKVKIDKFLIT